jgi:hypothetical protein
LIAIVILNGVFAWTASKFLGLTNFDEGMLVEGAMIPIGAGLQEPPLTCWPFVRGMSTVRQKLIKLFGEVRDGTWPAGALACPSCWKFEQMTPGSNASR